MAITNATELTAAILDYLDDPTMTDRVPDFIALFEAKASRILRTADTVATASLTTNASGKVALPATFRSWRGVRAGGRSLRFYDPAEAYTRTTVGGNAYGFTIEGRTLTLIPPGVATVDLVHTIRIPPLAEASSNWLLTDHPDIYLYGSLIEAEAYGFNDARLGTWRTLVAEGLDQIVTANLSVEWGDSAMVLPEYTP